MKTIKSFKTLTIVFLFMIGVVNYLDRSALSIANTSIQHDLAISPTQMGFLLSAFSLAYAFSQLPMGALIDRLGSKLALGGSLIVWSLAQAAFGLFSGFGHLLGMPMFQVAPDTFACRGHLYRFAIACTAVDAFMGSIPLLWMGKRSVGRNLVFLAVYFAALSAANLVRLAAGLWIFLHGVSWWISHEAFAGVFYFALFLWIAHRRGWSVPRTRQTALVAG